MKEEKITFTIRDYPLEKFTNAELYYIVSSLLGLGDPGFGSEHLYLSFEEMNSDGIGAIRFLLITADLHNEKEVTSFHLGQIDSEFDEVQIYSGYCSVSEFTPEKEKTNIPLIRSYIIEKNDPNEFRPLTFLKGISRITSDPNFFERKENDLFKFYSDSPLPEEIRHSFDFGNIGPLGTNFTGNYYLVVKPSHHALGGAKVSIFKVFDNEADEYMHIYIQDKIEISYEVINSISIQRYDRGEAESMNYQLPGTNPIAKGKEDPENHKSGMLKVISGTVYALLVDLAPPTKEKLLSGETTEELIVHSKQKYDEEFDLHFPSLGIAGAHEIAWQEVFSEFNDDHWKEPDNE